MKKDIHPKTHAVKSCCSTCESCYEVGSTATSFSVDVCSGCHPVYTGDRSMAKATGRIDRFNKMLSKKETK